MTVTCAGAWEGCCWCFFLEKKDILRDLPPRMDGMAGYVRERED